MDDITLGKIVITKKNQLEEIFQYVEKDQLEQKYGGSKPDMTENFWPVKLD